ncbi:uncharacterized protein LOC115076287 [Rhinatrema bivittatum]|uniref:uncharacterized protein LOC115076287 n=1 Tax=Rhinatrema bivittatum TaxID=194408 RepID=UPI0011292738|nr:uncharacterized protein LOC115076287 [Rhinatrema bivittatum]
MESEAREDNGCQPLTSPTIPSNKEAECSKAQHPPKAAVPEASAPAEGRRVPEKKPSASSIKHSSSLPLHHKAMEKINHHSSSASSPLDLQSSVFGRSSSSLSSMTVPIRLDALSYLLNNALMGAGRMAPQRLYCGNQCAAMQMCPASPAPVCRSQMGQYAQPPCSNYTGCTMHCTPPACFAQPLAYPGSLLTDPSKLPGRPAGGQLDVPSAHPPVFPNKSVGAWNAAGGGYNQHIGGSGNVPEANKWASAPTETFGERQSGSFGPARGSFSRSSECQSAWQDGSSGGSPKRGFGSSPKRVFGGWKDNQGRGGHSWSERPPRDYGRAMGRASGEFSSGSWRRNPRDENRDSLLGEKTWSSGFGNRKRNQEEKQWPTEEELPPKLGLWANGRGGGAGRGRGGSPWQQRRGFESSSVQSDLGGSGDRFKSSTFAPSSVASASSSCMKEEISSEDWEAEYKPRQLPTPAQGVQGEASLEPRPRRAASTKQDDWESDCKEESSSPLVESKTTETSKEGARNTSKEKPDESPGVFEKFINGFFSDMVPKGGESRRQPEDVDGGECSDSTEEVDVGVDIANPTSQALAAHSQEGTKAPEAEEPGVVTEIGSSSADREEENTAEAVSPAEEKGPHVHSHIPGCLTHAAEPSG